MYWPLIFVHLAVALYLGTLLTLMTVKKLWNVECMKKLKIWMIGDLVIQILYVLKNLCYVVIWQRAKRPHLASVKVQVLGFIIISIPDIAFDVYGSTFIFGGMDDSCSEKGLPKLIQSSALILILTSFAYYLLQCVKICLTNLKAWRDMKKQARRKKK